MAKKRPPKRKPAPKGKRAPSKARTAKKRKASRSEIKPLYGDFFEKYVYPRANWLALGVMALLCLIVFGDYLFGRYLYLFKDMGSDTLNIVFPRLAQNADLIRESGFTSWSFRQGMGQTIYPIVGGNPIEWLNLLVGKEYIPYLIIWIGVLKNLLAGVFFYQYLKTLGRTAYTCLLGSVIYAFSGYVMGVHSWYSFNMLFVAGALLLWGTELLLKKNNGIVFPIAIYFLAGPRLVTFGIFLLIYSLFRYLDEKGWDPKGLLIFWLKMAGLGALGLMLAAWFFGVRFTTLMESSRISGPASRTDSLLQTPIFALNSEMVNVTSLMRLFSNEMMGSVQDFKGYRNYLEAPFYYVGLVSLLLIPQAFFHLNKKQLILFGSLLGLWLFFCLFPFFRFGFFLFVTDQFRSFSLDVSYILLFFSLFALSKILQSGKVNLPALGISLLVLLALLNYPWGAGEVDGSMRAAANVLLVVEAVVLLMLANPRLKYLAQGLLLLLVAGELAYFGYAGTHNRDMVTRQDYQNGGQVYNDDTMDALASIRKQDDGFFRVQKDFTSSPAMHYGLNDALAQGFFGTPSYQSQNQKNYLRFMSEMGVIDGSKVVTAKWAPGLGSRFLLQNLASIKYVLRQDNGSDLLERGYTRFGGEGNVRIFKNPYFLPFGYTYDSYYPYSEFKQVDRNKKDIGLMQAAVVFDNDLSKVDGLQRKNPAAINPQSFTFPVLQSDVATLGAESFQMTDFEHDRLEGSISLSKEKLLFFSIPYDAGWSAKVNGEPAELLQVNMGFTGLVLPAGQHEVVLEHNPPGLLWLWLITALGLAIWGFLLFQQIRRKT